MKPHEYYNEKCKELGFEDFGDFLDKTTVDTIASLIIYWTEEYAKQANGGEIDLKPNNHG